MSVYFHGGVAGLKVGESLVPGHSRDDRHPGCKICEARAAGHSRIDNASAHQDRVYVTTDRDYARFHASMYGHGDLYLVEPVGELLRSKEDLFPSFTVESARVVAVLGRRIQMKMTQRRKLYVQWARLEGLTKRQALDEYEQMIARAATVGGAP